MSNDKKNNGEFYVYMFLNNEDKPLYIGRSINLVTRIESDHFGSENGNLSAECIKETSKILYHKALSIDDMKIKERYLINTLSPKYNKSLNNDNKFSFTIDINWKLYSIDKVALIEKQINKKLKRELSYSRIIQKTQNSWLPYGVTFNKKINYLTIKPQEKSSTYSGMENLELCYFLKINNEIYIHNFSELSYYTVNFREFCKYNSMNERIDFLSVLAPEDNKLFKDTTEGMSFVRYETVKKHYLIDEKTLSFFDKKLSKIFKLPKS